MKQIRIETCDTCGKTYERGQQAKQTPICYPWKKGKCAECSDWDYYFNGITEQWDYYFNGSTEQTKKG